MEVHGDYTTSIIKAFDEIDPAWRHYRGIVIGGSHNPHDTENIIRRIKDYRESRLPIYAECFGYQLCAIEYARNVLGIKDATSEEFGEGTFVVKKRKDGLNVGLKDGESYWNNYEVILEDWEPSTNMFIAQYHPSYQSSIDRPHKLISNFLKYARTMAMPSSKKSWRWFFRNAK